MDLAPDFDEFIASLRAHGVEFVIVGAYALAFHGAPRFTGDLDVLVRPTLENGSRVLAAVRAFGFPVDELRPEDVADGRRMLQMGVEPVQIHVMSAISGVSSCRDSAVNGDYSGASSHSSDKSRSIASNGSARMMARPDHVERIVQRPPSRRRTSRVRAIGSTSQECDTPSRA